VSVAIPSSTGCALIQDSVADQIDVLDDGNVFVLLRCGTQLRLSSSTDGARTFSTPVAVATGLAGLPDTATVFARSATAIFVLYSSTTNARIVSSSDRGSTWTTPVLVTNNYTAPAGPGSSLVLTGRVTDLFATWSNGCSPDPGERTGLLSAGAPTRAQSP
jgi:hypothetical protein